MRNVSLPDPLYEQAAKKAESRGLSLESFVASAVRDRLDDGFDVPDSFFTPEILAEIDAAVESANRGPNQTMDEVMAEAANWREEWLRTRRA